MSTSTRESQPQNVPIPTTDTIFGNRSRFRILVVGRTGTGKSSLINAAFNVDDATVSNEERGISNINEEIKHPKNPRVVIHDSMGFEPGETENINILKTFIHDRARETGEKRLDFVWLCIETPTAGQPVLETGTEIIMDLLINEGVPFLLVFTKYDTLVNKCRRRLPKNPDVSALNTQARSVAVTEFQRTCEQPLAKWTREKPTRQGISPVVRVSNKLPYHDTLETLMNKVFENLPEDTEGEVIPTVVESSAQVLFAAAQNVTPKKKLEFSIKIGRRGYWRGLARGTRFPGLKLDACLRVLHRDIVNCWNLGEYFSSESFENCIINIRQVASAPKVTPTTIIGVASAAAGVSGVSGPLAPIVVPVVFGVVCLGGWIYQVYRSSEPTVRNLMTYIIDLEVIMWKVFELSNKPENTNMPSETRGPLLAHDAVVWYMDSTLKRKVEELITEFFATKSFLEVAEKDTVMQKVIEILQSVEEMLESELAS